MTSLHIIGAGGHGKVVADVATAAGYDDIVFLDDRFPTIRHIGSFAIVGPIQSFRSKTELVFCAIGDNHTRARVSADVGVHQAPVLLHPAAVLSSSAKVGSGTILIGGAIVNVDAQIGKGVILNTGCSVDHDCVLEDYVHVSPGARLAGGVSVGVRSWIGIGAVVREGVRIGSDVVVGAGAAVICDIPNGSYVAGVPAKPLPSRLNL